eukprot:scaffold1151_cov126-Isochrysis_galbana.AAC.16
MDHSPFTPISHKLGDVEVLYTTVGWRSRLEPVCAAGGKVGVQRSGRCGCGARCAYLGSWGLAHLFPLAGACLCLGVSGVISTITRPSHQHRFTRPHDTPVRHT